MTDKARLKGVVRNTLSREQRQRFLIDMLNALHDADWTTLIVESVQMEHGMHESERHEDYYARIIIDSAEVSAERLHELVILCAEMDASLSVQVMHLGGSRSTYSHLVIWPSRGQ